MLHHPQVGWLGSGFPGTAVCHGSLESVSCGPCPGPLWAAKRGQADRAQGPLGSVDPGPGSPSDTPSCSPPPGPCSRCQDSLLVPSHTKQAHTLEPLHALSSLPGTGIHTAGTSTSCSHILIGVPPRPPSVTNTCPLVLPSAALLSPFPCLIFFHSSNHIIHTVYLSIGLYLVCLCSLEYQHLAERTFICLFTAVLPLPRTASGV